MILRLNCYFFFYCNSLYAIICILWRAECRHMSHAKFLLSELGIAYEVFWFQVSCVLVICFYQDDYRISLKYNIITKDMAPICPLDMSGRFIDPVVDFKGQHVKVFSMFFQLMFIIWSIYTLNSASLSLEIENFNSFMVKSWHKWADCFRWTNFWISTVCHISCTIACWKKLLTDVQCSL